MDKYITTEKARPDWNDYFKEIVKVVATRSTCSRLQVGCVIVKDRHIVATGYNGTITGTPNNMSILREGHEQATIHAEQNAIIDCAKRGVCCNDSEAYITHYPCLNCYKTLVAAGIKKIYYIENYKEDSLIEEFIKFTNVKISKL